MSQSITVNGRQFAVHNIGERVVMLVGRGGSGYSLVRNQIGVWWLVGSRVQQAVRSVSGIELR